MVVMCNTEPLLPNLASHSVRRSHSGHMSAQAAVAASKGPRGEWECVLRLNTFAAPCPQDILPQHVAASLTRKARSMTQSCGRNAGWDLPTIVSATSSSTSSSSMTTQTQAHTTSRIHHQHPSDSGSRSSEGSSRMHSKSFALAEEKVACSCCLSGARRYVHIADREITTARREHKQWEKDARHVVAQQRWQEPD
ncbi:hypothetical protein HaLaN_17561, partial [Haematococcus lacustris]